MIRNPIKRFKTGTYAWSRPSATTYVDGVGTTASTAQTPVDASVQPVSGRALEVVPEARRTSDMVLILCETRIEEDDIFTLLDDAHPIAEDYCIVKTEHWCSRGITWTRAYAARKATP